MIILKVCNKPLCPSVMGSQHDEYYVTPSVEIGNTATKYVGYKSK
jgi:hypothetical protein